MNDVTRWEWIKAIRDPDGGPGGGPTMRLVLLTLATHMDRQGGSCHPSIALLSRETLLGERTVRRDLIEAEEAGWIRRRKRGRGYAYQARKPAGGAGVEGEGNRQDVPVSGEEIPAGGAGSEPGHRQEVPVSTPAGGATAAGGAGEQRQEVPVQGGIQGREVTTTESPSDTAYPQSIRAQDPVKALMLTAAEAGADNPEWKDEHPTGQEVVRWWIDLNRGDVPRGEIAKQGAAGRRIAERHPRGAIIRALIGMGQVFPYSEQAWDLFDLERKFAKAYGAFSAHPIVEEYRFDREMEATG